jgi:two-component system response regulator GlrR
VHEDVTGVPVVTNLAAFHQVLGPLEARTGTLATIEGAPGTRPRFEVKPDHVRIPVAEWRSFGRLVSATPAMREVFAILERAAAGDATVLLEGETGTGKDAAAESIHEHSARRARPLRVIDCGALPAALIESELFGHERGAFTGAATARAGAFEAAEGGTVFLDEIGELPLELQPKLLRVLERRQVKRLGATEHLGVDVRVIAATNRDLREEVKARRFRPDLYWRLAVVTVRLPPLRDRGGDLPVLVDNLIAAYPPAVRAALRSPELLAELARHTWPGNVRELRNHLDRCATLGPELAPPLSGSTPAPRGQAPALDAARPLREAREDWTRHAERGYLEDLLRRHPDNLAAAARAAGVDRAYLYRLLWKHKLR